MNEIFKRISVRRYEHKDVEPEKIEQILRAAMQAPSAGNQQPWEFYVVRDRDVIDQLSKCNRYARPAKYAPVVIVCCMRTEAQHSPELVPTDLAIATEHILLEITSLGLGGVWLSVAPYEDRMEKVSEALSLDEAVLRPFAMVSLGYPAEDHPQPDRFDASRIHYIPADQ